ncbi:MAG: hypothetical protein H7290_01685 [Flavobacterium sp.]|nr:hypothetical protein [Aeromicrobium sp.]
MRFVLAGGMPIVAKPYPKEFRDDVVAVARTADAPLNQIAKDFGIWRRLPAQLAQGRGRPGRQAPRLDRRRSG